MEENRQWLLRLMGLMLILAMILGYQMKALAWQSEKEQNDAAVRSAEQHNAEIRAEQEKKTAMNQGQSGGNSGQAQNGSSIQYRDGLYTASGRGFGGIINLTVTISGGKITDITINDSSSEDKVYFDMAVSLVDSIIAAQSPEVDAVSGATFSSNGIKEAVRTALKEAQQ